jgi:hypothetical protein
MRIETCFLYGSNQRRHWHASRVYAGFLSGEVNRGIDHAGHFLQHALQSRDA